MRQGIQQRGRLLSGAMSVGLLRAINIWHTLPMHGFDIDE